MKMLLIDFQMRNIYFIFKFLKLFSAFRKYTYQMVALHLTIQPSLEVKLFPIINIDILQQINHSYLYTGFQSAYALR